MNDFFPQQDQQQMQQPPMPEPPDLGWGPPDETELARQKAGYVQVQKDLARGAINPGLAGQALAGIAPGLSALLKRQKQAQAQASQAAQQAAMQQVAQQESMETVNRSMRARDFDKTVAKYDAVDPITGATKTAHFVQDSKGNWKEIDFPEKEAAPEQEQMQNPVPVSGSASSSILAAGQNANNAPTPGGEPMSLEQFGQQQRESVNPVNKDFEQTIQSGPYTEKYQGGQLASTDRPAKADEQVMGLLSPKALQHIHELADRTVPLLGPNASPHEQLLRQGHVNELASKMVSRHYLERQHQLDEASKAAEHIRQEHSKNLETMRQEAVKKAEWDRKHGPGGGKPELGDEELAMHFDKEIKTERAAAVKARDKALADAKETGTLPNSPSLSKLPPELNESNHVAEVRRRVAAHRDLRAQLKADAVKSEITPPGGNKTPTSNVPPPTVDKPPPANNPHPAPAPAPVDENAEIPEHLRDQPSKDATKERIGELMPLLDKAFEGRPWHYGFSEGPTGPSNPFTIVKEMRAILRKASQRGDGLTLKERRDYDILHRRLPQSPFTEMIKSGRPAVKP